MSQRPSFIWLCLSCGGTSLDLYGKKKIHGQWNKRCEIDAVPVNVTGDKPALALTGVIDSEGIVRESGKGRLYELPTAAAGSPLKITADITARIEDLWQLHPSIFTPTGFIPKVAVIDGELPFGAKKEDWSNPIVQNERDRLIDEEMAKRNYPINSKNAARAGWYAALRWVVEQQGKSFPENAE